MPTENLAHSLQKFDKSQSAQLPVGWTQGQHTNGTSFYTNEMVPTERFRYPLPLANEDTSALLIESGRYLRFKSQRASLFLGRKLTDPHGSWTTCPACLVDHRGNRAGTIRLNTSRFGSLPIGQSYELVILSLATAVEEVVDHPLFPERKDITRG